MASDSTSAGGSVFASVEAFYDDDDRRRSPERLCLCGCGGTTPPATRTRLSLGTTKGEPIRYLQGHGRRATAGPPFRVEGKGCWIWQRWVAKTGYGELLDGGIKQGAHVVYFKRAGGLIPKGYVLHHRCGNKLCVNPAHLEPLSRRDHVRRHVGLEATL
jgi:hypothetical protein